MTVDWTTQGKGTEDAPFIVSSTDDWNVFADYVNSGYAFSGEFVKLTQDISISTPVGSHVSDSDNKPFSGTFLGDGHTITVTLTDDGKQGLAPFRSINGATIRDLKVAGTITSNQHHTAGLVGFASTSAATMPAASSATDRLLPPPSGAAPSPAPSTAWTATAATSAASGAGAATALRQPS